MKTWEVILKIVTALLAIAGIIFVIVTYGDKIVAWFKRMFGKSEVTLYDDEEIAPVEEVAEDAAEEADFAE
jgi:hypothetical protein